MLVIEENIFITIHNVGFPIYTTFLNSKFFCKISLQAYKKIDSILKL